MVYKYAMILVYIDPDNKEETCQLVEVCRDEGQDGFTSFCRASLLNPKELERAAKEVSYDGVNKWFYENGIFYKTHDGYWSWEKHLPYLDKALTECGDLETYEDEIELYKVYGGD